MEITHYATSALSLAPPLIAVILAIWTRKVLLSLGMGILAGSILVSGFSPLGTAEYIGDVAKGIFWADGAVNSWNVNILLFLLLLGGIISLMTVSGATRAFADWAATRIKSRRGAKILTGCLVFLFFIDDYFHSLSVGSVCRPVTDRFQISRAKLAYLLDSTAAPVCVLMPISSWGAYIIAIIGGILAAHGLTDQTPISAFIQMIPMNLYAVFTLAMVLVVIFYQLDIGAMRQHEEWAAEGKLWDESKGAPAGASGELSSSDKGRVLDLVLPILTLTLSTVYFMVASGAAALAEKGTPFTLLGAFENTDVGASLVNGGLCGLAVAILLSLRLGLGLKNWMLAAKHGVMAMLPAIYILIFAWGIGAVIREVETGKYLASLAQSGLPIALLPAVLFVLSGAMAFSTGTSWGTFGIMLPLAGDMAAASDITMLLPMLSAVLAGAVFGDHCSPISDTTILSSTGAGCHHIDHVVTQLPYALTIAFGAVLGYLALGLMHSVLAGVVVSGIWFMASSLFFIRRNQPVLANA
ncbi:Na+/H+ antiporter NhaC family protein [Aeromonas schubertii]|uniref:Na+/H+ antiporter NhaC family protein n=1 Tax=Aeromonas schubertii TaxID=652 RepID=A0ABS7VEN8_9GAMM|nr:Na+/H+ antiporter NhaC family protein [Aeromonas schubertii]KUE81605.1 Na+/H+ antiporter [Aeromonas schubertii]MBZ6067458.1 Na+/H+ antiporter NhaC family protein [Aeromonas schubertii]